MTLDELLVLDMLRELKALERLQLSVGTMFAHATSASSYEWRCGLMAIQDRLDWLRDCLSREDAELLNAVDDLYRQELQAAALKTETIVSVLSRPDLPPGARIH